MNPAECRRQYSSRLTVPKRLCSISCRVVDRRSKPASTLQFAAASIIQSAGGRQSTSLAFRISPWKTLVLRWLRRRFDSLPDRIRLSIPKTSASGVVSRIRRASTEPTNPQIPAISTFIENGNLSLMTAASSVFSVDVRIALFEARSMFTRVTA